MNKKAAIHEATGMLQTLIANQPKLMEYEKASKNTGEDAAEFCIAFIETYAAWLEKQAA